jgi:hypothetical protein
VIVTIEPTEFVVRESIEDNMVEFIVRKNGTSVRDVEVAMLSISDFSRG